MKTITFTKKNAAAYGRKGAKAAAKARSTDPLNYSNYIKTRASASRFNKLRSANRGSGLYGHRKGLGTGQARDNETLVAITGKTRAGTLLRRLKKRGIKARVISQPYADRQDRQRVSYSVYGDKKRVARPRKGGPRQR